MGLSNIFGRSKKTPPTAEEWGLAVYRKDIKRIESLLKRGADIDQVNSDGYTALYRVALLGEIKVLRFLVDHGADIHRKSCHGDTPLECARYWDNTAAVQRLEEAVAQQAKKKKAEAAAVIRPKIIAGAEDDTLAAAVDSGDCQRVRDIFNSDFWANKKISPGWEHLKIAVMREDEPMMRLLVTWGARAPDDAAQLQDIDQQQYARYVRILKQSGLPLPAVSLEEMPETKKVEVPNIDAAAADDWKYVGISVDTGKPMYVAPADAGLMNWDAAVKIAESLEKQIRKDVRLPSEGELKQLFSSKAKIGGFNETASDISGFYWSSSPVSGSIDDLDYVRGQRFSDGFQSFIYKSSCPSTRFVRSEKVQSATGVGFMLPPPG